MITRIIDICARNRLAVLLVAAAAVATGPGPLLFFDFRGITVL